MEQKENTYQQYMQEVESQEPFDPTKVYEQWQQSKKPIFDIVMQGQKKPEPTITPEQEKRAKFASSLTDTFSTIGEMFAHGQGARVRNREGVSSTQTTNARLQALKDKAEKDMLQYNAMESNANLQDFNMHLSNAMRNRGEMREAKMRATEWAARQAEAERQAEAAAAKQAAAAKLAADKMAEDKRQFDKRIGLEWYKATKEGQAAKEKEEREKYVPIYINQKRIKLPKEDIETIVARAIRDGLAGEVSETIRDMMGSQTVTNPVTITSKLTPEQKRQIFEAVYPKYVYADEKGNVVIRQQLRVAERASGKSAQEMYNNKKPAKKPGAASPAADPLGIF